MNKRPNPFFPQQTAYPNPPLPPGLPPQQQHYDYSAYWAAAQAAQQPGLPQPIPQWTAPHPTPGPSGAGSQVPANQTSLYANYGYGGQQNFNWQRPGQQPQRQPFPIPPAGVQTSQPYFPHQQQHHPPSAQPGRIFASPAAHPFPQPSQPYRPQQPIFHQQQQPPPPPPQHSPPHLPPAKRPRFEGPPVPHPPSLGSGPSGPGHGNGRGGSNGIPGSFGPARGGGPPNGPGTRGAPPRGRGGTMGIGGGPSIGMMRGGALNNAGSRGVRGGHATSARGSHPPGQSGGHRGGRGGWHNQNNQNRRGAPGSGRSRGSGFAHANHSRDGGAARFNGPSTLADKERSSKKEEVRQTLTDFRIVGLEIESLKWTWGSCISSRNVDSSKAAEPVKNGTETTTGDSQLDLTDGVEEIEFGSAIQETADASVAPEVPVLPPQVQPLSKTPGEPSKDSRSPLPGPPAPSPPRIRIYFNTPASLDDTQPKPVNGVSNVSANRAKRKLSVEEEEEGRRRRTKLNPTSEAEEALRDTPSKTGEVEKDRDSVAPSVDMSATASVSGRTEDESDWLMEAIGRDAEATEDQDESTHQSTDHDRAVDVEVEGDPDGEFADANHVKEDLGLSNDTDTISLKVPTDLAGTGNQEQTTLSSGDEGKELPAPSTTSIEPIDDLSASQICTAEEGHLLPQDSGPEPEPPASPVSQSTSQQSLSQTLHSSGGSLASPSSSQATTLAASSQIPGLTNSETVSSQHRLPSPNRVSISYASGARRLLIDAQVVETMKIWRGEGRIEVLLSLERQGDLDLKGLLAETYSPGTQSYARLQLLPTDDDLLPPLTLTIYLDKDKPMTEPRWVKTGDVEEWLRNTFGIFWVSGDDGWEKRIEVVDPDPPPTIHTVLENWSSSSLVGLDAERQRFVKTHMCESGNMLEILLRLVRGERATPISFSNTTSSSNLHLSGPLLTALSPNSPHASQQTHLTLAIVAMVRMAESFAERVMPSDEGKREVEERVGEIIRCLPQHLLYKSLDGIFREWKDIKKKGRG
ncbi:hypothetical protein JB92DRAFT_2896025 [Gautieria morchelliformis]|nr:hypothetical protein JB92DRAFT_2896025 [Gautieria morchelliformis]